jgi:hypothetical protein
MQTDSLSSNDAVELTKALKSHAKALESQTEAMDYLAKRLPDH